LPEPEKNMIPGIFHITIRSITFHKKPVLYQIIIIAILSAVITGSLMTGKSVRTSLKKTASERLGNTGILISSGIRYFDASLAERLKSSSGLNTTGLLEITGFCRNLNSQKGAFNTHIYAINEDFFTFHGNDRLRINSGEAAVNRKLADYLELKTGDEIIIRFNEISDIPADAPFAPEKSSDRSIVLKVGSVLEPANTGNFSLSISQIVPMNVFFNITELKDIRGDKVKTNRLLIENRNDISSEKIYDILRRTLKPSDIGLSLRTIKKTDEIELISDRVFVDNEVISEVKTVLPSSAPVLTYLANRFTAGQLSTPYSFISALPSSLYPEIVQYNSIIINRWMAEDLGVNAGDSVKMFWFSPDSLNNLTESSTSFIINRIVDMEGIWSDSLLMPDFPGIAGSESCSDWDAGVPVKLDDIRKKDELYWNKFRGTPKAFINYNRGKELWGNNFGTATSLRFPKGITENEIREKLSGSFDPSKTGFTVSDISKESVIAANQSVDFSTLFLSLGFFLISASVVLLSFAVTTYSDSKKGEIKTLFAIGFNNRLILKLLFFESSVISLIGCLIGSIAGYLVNMMITIALNSVWSGAVQTDTLEASFSLIPMLTGFSIAILITTSFMWIRIKQYLKQLNRAEKEKKVRHSIILSRLLSFTFLLFTVILFVLSAFYKNQEIPLCFASGTLLLVTLILFWRQYIIVPERKGSGNSLSVIGLSRKYYSFYPSHAITPVLFIAAGIFAVFITGANRMNFNEKHLKRSGGTGGYLFWCDNTIAVKEDLNSVSGRKSLGFDSDSLKDLNFVQAKRSSGDDASCLNLNHVTAPPLIGIDPADFISGKSFSFSRVIDNENVSNPWQFLNKPSENNTIYGVADQSVLDWGLKIKPGDTLTLRAENGQPLNIIIAAGLKSSVFQGYVLIGLDNFIRYYPSVPGSSILLVHGNPELVDLYRNTLNERLGNYGTNVELTTDRLASFYEVTNTYLSVFGVFGALGMITGIAGLGFVLLRNYNHRKKEFSLMMATGFSLKSIKRMILSEQVMILIAGIVTGVLSAFVATLPSIRSSPDIPWIFLGIMIFAVIATGLTALTISVRTVTRDSLTASLKKE
jgi:putative ABC transport system permease protein